MRLFVLSILAFGVIQASEAQASEEQTYEVRPRDRFETLATRFGVTPEEIRAANPGAYGIKCLRPFRQENRSGETIAYCGRPRYYLIAGKTLVIPASRLLVESENVRLDAENTALEAERNQARTEYDSLEQERDVLLAERDELKRVNEATLREKAELQGRYDELKQASAVRPENNMSSPAASKSPAPSAMYNREAFLFVILAIVGCSLLVIAHRHFTRPGLKLKRSAEELRRERANFKIVRSALAEEGKELAERRRRLDADDLEIRTQRSTLEHDQERLRNQRDELGKWEESLKAREAHPASASEKPKTVTAIGVPPIFPHVPTGTEKTKTEAGLLHVMVARGRQLLEDDFRTLAGREAACTAREKAIGRRTAALDSLREALEDRERNLTTKEHGVEELRRTFSSGKARCDLTDIAQTEREENLVRGFADLKTQQERVYAELEARRTELNRSATEIDAKIRMYDEDIVPEIKKAREELAERERTLAEREKTSSERAADNDRRAQALDAEERDYERRLQELANANGLFDKKVERLAEEQLEFQSQRDEFTTAVEEAKGILTRAKRKKEITDALDRRESAVAGKERELADLAQKLDDRAANLGTWEERLRDKARGFGLTEEDDEQTRQILPSSPEESITHLDFTQPGSGPPHGVRPAPESGLAIGVELYTCAVCNQTMDAAEVEAHKAVCPKTARHVETITPPAAALLPESFYCNICLAIVASTEDEYQAHQERHKRGAASKPEASGEDRAEAPSRFVCPQCGKSVDWEEIETHKCVL